MTRTWHTLEVHEGGATCEVVLARERISMTMVVELEEVCHYLDDESPSSVVILRGRQPGIFTRGIDLSDFSLHKPPDIHGFNKWERALECLERLKKITVAVLEGECGGGGVQLALACDYRIATPQSRLMLDEVKMGFLPGLATYRLAKHIGLGRARWLVLSGRAVHAEEALAWGLVQQVCGPDRLRAELDRVVMEFLPVNGTVVSLARRLLNDSYAKSHEDFLGDFLAAQHRAVVGETFMRRLQEEALRPPRPADA